MCVCVVVSVYTGVFLCTCVFVYMFKMCVYTCMCVVLVPLWLVNAGQAPPGF